MNEQKAIEIVLTKIKEVLAEDNQTVDFDENSSIIGTNSILNSLSLVTLCTKLEDEALDLEDSFEFDWTSEKAMSNMHSIFRTPKTLAQEFLRQANEKK
ncbi:MAG: hypothetical protein IJ505_00885 [Succinivibrio sp.]|nr:hypothetical protein [Succinivibrio sp.]